MRNKIILATAFSLLGGFGASAEPLRAMQAPPGALPAFEAVTITRSMGLDPLGGPVWRNGRYVVLATDDSGREMRVVIDGRSGDVLAVRPVAANYFAPGPRPYDGYGRRELIVRGPYDNQYGARYVPLPDDGYDDVPQRRESLAPPAVAPRSPATTSSVTPAKPAAAAEKPKPKPVQSAKVTPEPSKPKPADAAVQRHESRPQTASQSSSTTGSGAAEKKEIRKIEIDKKPVETEKTPEAAPAPAADAPINPLL